MIVRMRENGNITFRETKEYKERVKKAIGDTDRKQARM
jgi:hypothetical protein